MNPTLKRHLISAGTTFVAGFAIGILPFLNSLDPANFGKAAFFGLCVAGIRAGVKLVVENLILPKFPSATVDSVSEPQG